MTFSDLTIEVKLAVCNALLLCLSNYVDAQRLETGKSGTVIFDGKTGTFKEKDSVTLNPYRIMADEINSKSLSDREYMIVFKDIVEFMEEVPQIQRDQVFEELEKKYGLQISKTER